MSFSYQCPTCSFEIWHPLGSLQVSAVGLYDDARFPGRCLVVLRAHAVDLIELERPVLHSFIDDARDVGAVLLDALQATRINYAVLGNVHAHLHFHVIPRYGDVELRPERPPWETGEQWRPLPESERVEIGRRIEQELAARNR